LSEFLTQARVLIGRRTALNEEDVMSQDINQRLIARIGQRDGRSTSPRAVSLEPEVRTPIDVVPVTQPRDDQRRPLNELPPLKSDEPSVGPYLFEWQYNVRVETIGAFHDWLSIYETELWKLCPKHFRYLGTFEALFGPSGQSPTGRYRTLWQHADLAGTLHLLRGKQEGAPDREVEDRFIKLLKELISFQDTSTSSVRNSQLYQLVTTR
jgi:hypothetical protein